MVLPVPDKPKNNAVSPLVPALAEQCMGSRPALGMRKFMTVNTPFFISPAYSVPKITISLRSKLRSMLVVEVISEV